MWVISMSEFVVGLYLLACIIRVIETFARMHEHHCSFQLQMNEMNDNENENKIKPLKN